MIKDILILLALVNLIMISLSIYKEKSNVAIGLSIAEIVIVYLWLTL